MGNELSRVVDALPGLVWTALPGGRIAFLNQRWCEFTCLGVDEGVGQGWQVGIHQGDLPVLLERWEATVSPSIPRRTEGVARPRLGGIRVPVAADAVRALRNP